MLVRIISSPQLPPLSDFLLSPGFAGVLVVLGAIFALPATLRASRRRFNFQLQQQDRHHQEVRADYRRRETIAFCWERLVWLVRTAGAPSSGVEADEKALGLGPELTLAILEGLRGQARDLEDETLTQAVAVYLTQYGLALGDRLGRLPENAPELNGKSNGRHDRAEPAESETEPAEHVEDAGSVPAVASVTRGRHR